MIPAASSLRNGTHELERHVAHKSRTLRRFTEVQQRTQDCAIAAHGCAQHLGIAVVPGLGEMKLPAALIRMSENLARQRARQSIGSLYLDSCVQVRGEAKQIH